MTHNPHFTIGLDCRFAATHSGIGRYTRELVRELIKRDDPWQYHFFLPNEPTSLDQLLPQLKANSSKLIAPYYSLKEQIEFPKAIKEAHIDLLHVPHFNAPLRCPVPLITTIHDLILHDYPNEAGWMKRIAYKKLMNNAVKKSKHIIAVSNATKMDIVDHYGNDVDNKTTIIHNGLSPRFSPQSDEAIEQVRSRYNLPDRFALYVGASKEHKNVQTLINSSPDDLPLVLITKGREADQLSLRSNITILQPEDDDLPAIYTAASVYIQPSFKEGFGIPVLEAMACGTPVVASNTSSIPEIAGGHAILVEPTIDGLQKGILQALTTEIDLGAAALHAQSFTWKKAAEETAKVYKQSLY